MYTLDDSLGLVFFPTFLNFLPKHNIKTILYVTQLFSVADLFDYFTIVTCYCIVLYNIAASHFIIQMLYIYSFHRSLLPLFIAIFIS